jgi:hypothetical protein
MKLTRALLTWGIIAGPMYMVVGVLDPRAARVRHDVSRPRLMANGDWGWVHIALLVITALLTIGAAWGLRRAIHGSRGGTWGPLLVDLYGLGLAGAGTDT